MNIVQDILPDEVPALKLVSHNKCCSDQCAVNLMLLFPDAWDRKSHPHYSEISVRRKRIPPRGLIVLRFLLVSSGTSKWIGFDL